MESCVEGVPFYSGLIFGSFVVARDEVLQAICVLCAWVFVHRDKPAHSL